MPCSFLFSFPCWWQSQSNSSNFEFKDRLSDAIITMVTWMKYWFWCCCDLEQVQNTILCIHICGHSNQDLQAPPSQENIHHVVENCWKYFKFSNQVRVVFLQWLPWILRMGRPGEKITRYHLYGMRNMLYRLSLSGRASWCKTRWRSWRRRRSPQSRVWQISSILVKVAVPHLGKLQRKNYWLKFWKS